MEPSGENGVNEKLSAWSSFRTLHSNKIYNQESTTTTITIYMRGKSDNSPEMFLKRSHVRTCLGRLLRLASQCMTVEYKQEPPLGTGRTLQCLHGAATMLTQCPWSPFFNVKKSVGTVGFGRRLLTSPRLLPSPMSEMGQNGGDTGTRCLARNPAGYAVYGKVPL